MLPAGPLLDMAARRRGDFRILGQRTKMEYEWHGVHVVTQVMAIAIRAQEGWPIEAVLADRDNPEAPLHRWREGALGDAPEIEVGEVLADPSWWWLNVDLPAGFEHGYIASWKGDVKWVRGVPPVIPRWWPRWAVTLPDPARAERYTRYASRVCTVTGLLGLLMGSLLVVSGESGGWSSAIWSVAILWQGWALAGHGRDSARFVALHLGPVLFFLILAVTGGVKCIQYLGEGNASRALISLVGVFLSLLFVVVGLPRTIREWPRRSGQQRLQS
jgi:hypothetical protein